MASVLHTPTLPSYSADLEVWLATVVDDDLLRTAIERQVRIYDFDGSPITLAGLVYSAITEHEVPLALYSLVALIHIGVDLHDDVTDGDIMGGGRAEAQALLASATCLSSLAPQALSRLLTGSRLLSALHYFRKGLQTMASGQRVDLSLYGNQHPQPRIAESALRKSADFGIYVALSACVAGAAEEDLPLWNQFGMELGYALQISPDCMDAVSEAGRDIIGGARTLPVTLALQAGTPRDRERLRRDLALAPSDAGAWTRVRTAIDASKSLGACGTLVEVAIARAEAQLAQLLPAKRGSALFSFVVDCSWLRKSS